MSLLLLEISLSVLLVLWLIMFILTLKKDVDSLKSVMNTLLNNFNILKNPYLDKLLRELVLQTNLSLTLIILVKKLFGLFALVHGVAKELLTLFLTQINSLVILIKVITGFPPLTLPLKD